ncbi:unnamed protein product [Hyaloperonospora brassicae]|uniref:Transglutaminase elicitor n=1 Tax=Hyaloperonospora brassicae TaxID=162125 RepID=A0AAV0UZR3_HYABA|nr:unnamed protein product [Hyaloperonospora brassicae]
MAYAVHRRLIAAAVALVAVQLEQTLATSLYYDPVTTANTTDEISSKFPGRGAQVNDEDCTIAVEVDPTLPDLSTISKVPVVYMDLLANMTTAPMEAISSMMGTAVLFEAIPATEADQDVYTTTTTTTSTISDVPLNRKNIGIPTTTAVTTENEATEDELNCATGWDNSSRILRDAPAASRRPSVEKSATKRRLEANANQDIAKLEAYFGTAMEMELARLPSMGVVSPSPWPGPYWPTYQDGINVVWSPGQPSAAEKYATAFGLHVRDFMDRVSADNGVDSMHQHPKCSSDSDCSSRSDGSVCGKRVGKITGYCIPTWFGICHAWAPAATIEEEPQCPVTHNGVTFQPLDIKALISDVYDGAAVPTVFTGTRYNGGRDSKDAYGRHLNDAYRDLNPAYFHIAAANILGKLNHTFVADVTAGAEVWNQPVRGFKVYEQTAMSTKEAARTFYGLKKYPWNAAAKSIVYIKMRLSWIYETYEDGGLVSSGRVSQYTTGVYYTYLLELDRSGKIIGGEWVYDSDSIHPDFLWLPKSKPALDAVTSTGLKYADVVMLLKKSVACSDALSGSASNGSAEASPSTAAESDDAVASESTSSSGSLASDLTSTPASAASPSSSSADVPRD